MDRVVITDLVVPEVVAGPPGENVDQTLVDGVPDRPVSGLPLWFERGLVVVVAGVLGIGGVGLLLADAGHYTAGVAFAVGAAVMVVVGAAAWPRREDGSSAGRATHLPAFVMCGIAVGYGLWNGFAAGHYVSVDRDPGVYAVAGEWLAHHESLEVNDGRVWSQLGGNFNWSSAGMYRVGPGGTRLEFQFAHLQATLFAEAHAVGGDRAMFAMPALLAALGLCAVYAVGCRLLRRPWLVLVAVAALAVCLPELVVARDTYSETSAQFLLWAGLWLLVCAYERRRLGLAFLGGLAIGGVMLSRVDAMIYFVPLPLLAALAWVAATNGPARRWLCALFGAVLAGAIPAVVLAVFDLKERAGQYFDDLHSQVRDLEAAFLASLVLGVLVALIWPRSARLRTWGLRHRGRFALWLSAIAVVGLLLAWAVRPALMHPTGVFNPDIAALQANEGLAVNGARTYAEQSMTWLTWYLGPFTLAMGIAGVGVLVWRLIKRADAGSSMLLATAGLGTAIYLWDPSITPEQMWATRRFVPATIPFLLLAGMIALEAGIAAAPELVRRRWAAPAIAVATAGALVFPLGVLAPVANFQSQAGFLDVIRSVCTTVGPNAAVVFAHNDRERLSLLQTLRSFCDVSAASVYNPLSPAEAQQASDRLRAQGKTLWVLGSNPALVDQVVPGLPSQLVARATNTRMLAHTISRPGNEFGTETLTIFAAKVGG